MSISEQDVIAQFRGVSVRRLRVWVERGWVSPAESKNGHVYSELDLARVGLVHQLRDDLGVERDMVPVVLKLLDQVYSLRRELRCLTRAVEAQPQSVRRKITSELEKLRSS